MLSVYKMTKNPRGYCLIIDIENFEKEPLHGNVLKNRVGSRIDSDALESVFSQLGFIVGLFGVFIFNGLC